jgi:hypothetical protein
MFRAIFELLITILVVIAVRSFLGAVLRGLGNFQTPPPTSQQNPRQQQQSSQTHGELHRDPVCGTFVAENTRFQRQAGHQTFYYCSAECREKHALVAR